MYIYAIQTSCCVVVSPKETQNLSVWLIKLIAYMKKSI